MIRQIIWAPEALRDFRNQIRHIAISSPRNAILVANRIESAANALQELPTGRFGRVPDTYEKIVAKTSYIIAYGKTDAEINILRVIHTSQDWP